MLRLVSSPIRRGSVDG
nr:unnamed protein product [Callosobruchus chinensis]